MNTHKEQIIVEIVLCMTQAMQIYMMHKQQQLSKQTNKLSTNNAKNIKVIVESVCEVKE